MCFVGAIETLNKRYKIADYQKPIQKSLNALCCRVMVEGIRDNGFGAPDASWGREESRKEQLKNEWVL